MEFTNIIIPLIFISLIIWLSWSSAKDIYRALFKKRRLKKRLEKSLSPEARAIKNASEQGDYASYDQLINNADSPVLLELVEKNTELALSEQYAEEHPDKAEAHLLHGMHLLVKARQARGTGVAGTGTHQQVQGFLRCLTNAETELRQSLALSPDLIASYTPLLTVQMLKGNLEAAKEIFHEAKRKAPSQLDYHIVMLIILTKKWLGSHEKMFAFAREQASLDTASGLEGLIAAAHFEYWYSLEGKEANQYFKQPLVKSELQKAYRLQSQIEKDDSFNNNYQRFLSMNYFALCFLLMNEKKIARNIFKTIGPNFTYRPWCNLHTEPALAYMKHSDLVGA